MLCMLWLMLQVLLTSFSYLGSKVSRLMLTDAVRPEFLFTMQHHETIFISKQVQSSFPFLKTNST